MRRFGVVVAAVLAGMAFLGGAALGRSTVPDPPGLPLRYAERTGPATTVTDGPFSFRVVSWRCGLKAVVGDHADWLPDGQYCRLRVRVENTGPRVANYDTSLQEVVEADGTAYAADLNSTQISEQPTTMAVSGRAALEFDIWFEVPDDADIVAARFHGGSGTKGVTIDLPQ